MLVFKVSEKSPTWKEFDFTSLRLFFSILCEYKTLFNDPLMFLNFNSSTIFIFENFICVCKI